MNRRPSNYDQDLPVIGGFLIVAMVVLSVWKMAEIAIWIIGHALRALLLVAVCASAQGIPVPPSPQPTVHSPESRVTLAWDAEGGVSGYRVYQGPASGFYTNSLDAGDFTAVTMLVPRGTNYFVATAYASDGTESDFSREIFWTPPPIAPPLSNRVVCVWGRLDRGNSLTGVWARTRPLLLCETNPPEPVQFFRGYGLTITVTNF